MLQRFLNVAFHFGLTNLFLFYFEIGCFMSTVTPQIKVPYFPQFEHKIGAIQNRVCVHIVSHGNVLIFSI